MNKKSEELKFYLYTISMVILANFNFVFAAEIYDSFDPIAELLSARINTEIQKKALKSESIKIFIPNFESIDRRATPLGIQLAKDFTSSLTRYKKGFEVINPQIGEEAVKEQLGYFIFKNESVGLKHLLEKFQCQYMVYAPFILVESENIISFPSGIIINGVALSGEATVLCSFGPFCIKLNENIALSYKSLHYSIHDLLLADSLFNIAQTNVETNPVRAMEMYLAAYNKYITLGDIDIVRTKCSHLKNEFSKILNNIELDKISTEELVGIQGEALQKTLIVKATYNEKGIGNLKIRFTFLEDDGVIDTIAITDQKGEAKARIYNLESTGKIKIMASLDSIIGLQPNISPIQFEVDVRKKRNNSNILVSIKRNNMGSESDISGELINKLIASGFGNCYSDSVFENFDLKITGNIKSFLTGTLGGTFSAAASGTITAKDFEGKSISAHSANVSKVFGTSKSSAGADAITRVKSQLFEALLKNLKDYYPK